MSLSPGAKVGVYEVTSKLGEGGMGEVWRARDTRLGRDVAIKVLPAAFVEDAGRLARFEREARVLASLNHANIAAIYGFEEQDGTRALVMELVDGPTLADRLTSGPLSYDEALPVFRQIAEALDAAHSQGVIHRDLKPQNIKVREDETVKVLDFGLAKSADSAISAPSSDPTYSPTMTTPAATAAGMILGTAAYMSPEQARGRIVDKRADVWAFGVMLFECLSGRRLFDGETVTDTLAAVLRAEIDWSSLPAGLPAPLHNLLRRCLERDPRNRLHDIADARIVLDELLAGRHDVEPEAAAPARRAPAPVAWIAAALVIGALVGAAGLSVLRPARPEPSGDSARMSFRQLTSLPDAEGEPTLSPDGQVFAYVKTVDGQADIFVQRVDGRNPILLTGSCEKDDIDPAFSPDGGLIAFHSECSGGGLFVVGATGESVRKVTDVGFSPAWSPDGTEIAVVTERLGLPWGRTSLSELWVVEVATGERRRVSELDAMQPAWSPDGKRIAFWGLRGETSDRDIWTVAADGSELAAASAVPALDDPDLDWSPVWVSGGSALLFSSTRGGTMNLWRLAVDPGTGRPQGDPTPLTVPSRWAGWISASRDGRRIAYVDRGVRTTLMRAPFSVARRALTGPAQQVPLGTTELYDQLALSPDGGTVLFANAGLPQWLFFARADGSELRQLTEGPFRDRQAVFSPDGEWIAFQTTRWPSQMGIVHPDGSGLRALVSDRTDGWFPTWSPDGSRLAVSSQHGAYLLDPAATVAEGSTVPLPEPPDGQSFSPTSWTADGAAIVGLLQGRDGKYRSLAIYSIRESTYRPVPGDLLWGTALHDGNGLLAVSGREIVSVDVPSGATREIVSAPPGARLIGCSVSRDGNWLAWIEAVDESDIWLADLGP